MGFRLNVAQSIMSAIMDTVLSNDEIIQQATSVYIDDIYINESIAFTACVKQHLVNFGMVGKEPEWLKDSTRVLGLQFWSECNKLW